MTLPPHVSAIVFDCDGPLLDTETCWSRAEASLFADYGFGFGAAEKDLLIGRALKAACDNMAEYFGRPGIGGPSFFPASRRTRNTGRAHVRCSVAAKL
jgi:beta-phosphoglucomutase-like phosphatase (HAD superfamily)